MLKKILFLLIPLGIFSFTADSQTDIPAELKQKLTGKTLLKEIMHEVNAFYRTGQSNQQNQTLQKQYLRWKRWEHYMQNRLGPNGEFVSNIEKNLEALNELHLRESVQRSSTLASWMLVGPSSMQYQAGAYRGLGRVDCIAFHPTDANTIYVGTPAGGLWKTINGGTSWFCVTNALPTSGVISIAISNQNPNTVYIITGDGGRSASFYGEYNRIYSTGVWKSFDGGVNWTRTGVLQNGSGTYNAQKIVADPANDQVVYAAANRNLYKSINGGNTWNLLSLPYTGQINDIEFIPGSTSEILVSMMNLMLKSANAGMTWSEVTNPGMSGANRMEIAVSPANPNIVYAISGPVTGTGQFKGIWKSVNRGNSFSLALSTPNILGRRTDGADNIDQSNYDLAIAASPADANLFLTGGLTVWRSVNGGSSIEWATTYQETGNMAFYIHPDIQDLAYNPLNNHLFATTDGGVYRSTDNGVTWSDISSNISSTMFYSLAGFEADVNKLAGGSQDNGIKLKKDAGDFLHIIGGDGFDAVFDPNNSSLLYATGNTNYYGFSDGNLVRFNSTPNADMFPLIETHPVNSGSLYLLHSNGLYKSVTGGVFWTYIRAGGNRAIAQSQSNANRLFFTDARSIYRTDDEGGTWTSDLSNVFLNIDAISDIKVCPTNSDIVWFTVGGYSDGKKVFYSTDAGLNWQNLSGTLPNIPVHSIAIDNFNNAYIGTELGVFYQSNSSTDWTPYYNGMPKIPISELVINHSANKIRAATYGRGVWETELYSPCDADATLTGIATGVLYYQASNHITSSQTVTGGSATKVMLRAGNKITLQDGFSARPGIIIGADTILNRTFHAMIGNCEPGAVHYRLTALKGTVPAFASVKLPSNKKTNFPYGSITVNKKNSEVIINVNIFEIGAYSIITKDELGSFGKTLSQSLYKKGNYTIKFKRKVLGKNDKYVLLYYNNELVHFQEI